MEYKLKPLEVPSEDPFRYDALDRKAAVHFMANLVCDLEGPFVVAVDSPWGTGKTTFIDFLRAHLRFKGQKSIHLSAWEVDYATDPLMALLGELEKLRQADGTDVSALPHFQQLKRLGTVLIRRALPAAGKVATAGLLDLDNQIEAAISEFTSGGIKDAIDLYTAEQSILDKFRETLNKVVAEFTEGSECNKLVIFVDEIDRCRPTFAVALLERIKHLFSIENTIFILALDKDQLGSSLRAVYGVGLNTDEYLRRFFDLEYSLPEPDSEHFFDSLVSRFGLNDYFTKRKSYREFQNDLDHTKLVFVALAKALKLSLRNQEQCFTRMRVVMGATADNEFLHPIVLVALVVLRAAAPKIYRQFAFEKLGVKVVTDLLNESTEGREFLQKHQGAVFESFLICASMPRHSEISPELRQYKQIAGDDNASEQERERAQKILDIAGSSRMVEHPPSLDNIVRKVELASDYSP